MYTIGLTDSNSCSFCQASEETITHLFWDCHVIPKFIIDIQNEILNHAIISKESFLFGSNDNDKHLNFVYLYAKYFIFVMKSCQQPLTILSFRKYLKNNYNTEKCIAMKNNKFVLFENRWRYVSL